MAHDSSHPPRHRGDEGVHDELATPQNHPRENKPAIITDTTLDNTAPHH